MSDDKLGTTIARVLRAVAPVGDEAVRALAAVASCPKFAQGAWLLRAGTRAETCFLVTSGLVRELYVGDDGREHTRAFVAEGAMTGSLLDLLSGQPSVTYIQALEPTSTIAWPYGVFDALTARFIELNEAARRNAEQLYVRKTRREYEMLALPAAERYRRWLEEHADLDARVTRRDLASYLGMTPEHLSRLRRPATRSRSAPPRGRAR